MSPAINIRAKRKNLGLTLRQAAQAMGVEFNALARAERGDSVPTPRNARAIASFHGYEVTDLWPEPEPDRSPEPSEQAA